MASFHLSASVQFPDHYFFPHLTTHFLGHHFWYSLFILVSKWFVDLANWYACVDCHADKKVVPGCLVF